jgi:hypothetical protein
MNERALAHQRERAPEPMPRSAPLRDGPMSRRSWPARCATAFIRRRCCNWTKYRASMTSSGTRLASSISPSRSPPSKSACCCSYPALTRAEVRISEVIGGVTWCVGTHGGTNPLEGAFGWPCRRFTALPEPAATVSLPLGDFVNVRMMSLLPAAAAAMRPYLFVRWPHRGRTP